MKAISKLLFAVSALMLADVAIAKCQCGAGKSFEQAVADAQVIALATLSERKTSDDGANVEGTFNVKQTLKGILANQFKMTTAASKGDCGISFNDKQTYLFILDGKNWVASSCDHGGPIPADLEHPLIHEVEKILADPQKAIAQADSFQQQEVWIKQQGPELYVYSAKLKQCANDFELDKAAVAKQQALLKQAQSVWHKLMETRLDNPKLRSMLGNILTQQAAKMTEGAKQKGELDKTRCEALAYDGAPAETLEGLKDKL